MMPVRFLQDANQAGKQRKKKCHVDGGRAHFFRFLMNRVDGWIDGVRRGLQGGEQETRDREMRTHGTASVANIGGRNE